jgi:putative PIN family toxin of toxin-antitoxin system
MPLKVVLDTNLVVSGHLNPDGLERLVLNLALTDQVHFFITAEILDEYRRVLHRKKFRLEPAYIKESLQLIAKVATTIRPKRTLRASPDPDDNRFLECAEAAAADFLITGNKRHFPKTWGNTRIVNAREFIENLHIN